MIIGIDLGTTNSAVGIWRNGQAELIRNSLGSVLTPSAVSLTDEGELLVGLAARERQVTHPALTATAFKRYMGTQRETRLGKQRFLPEELSALVLRSLKADAEKALGEPVTDAVITVPAYFNDKQRQATRRAGQLAGLKVERLLNEPTAAALAYGIHQKGADTRFLVFDLGGGTFDVSLLELFDGVIEVRATTGDNHLGGEDFNEVLIDKMFAAHKKAWEVQAKQDEQLLYQKIRDQAERARRKLSTEPSATMNVAWRQAAFETTVTDEEFATLAAPLIERLRTPVLRALRDSRIQVDSLAEIVLVGGATRMPIVKRAVTKMFGRFPALVINPDEAVALGAAVQAGLKARDGDLREVVLTDVCPYSLGVDISERLANGDLRTGLFAPIIERNTVIPASRERSFSPLSDGQRTVEFTVYQGESPRCADNIALGKISIPLPAGRADGTVITCRFTYDINGLLEVDLSVPLTGERRQLVLMEENAPMGSDDLNRRRELLAQLKVHPRELENNRALIARGERCYESTLGDRRAYVGQCLSQFEQAIESQDPRTIETACESFTKVLDAIEGETYL
ncbi:MAG TPA: molecular chaperone HscC [Steroidobacteraceae bacterium]|nr:molecular chaperone HscC [Steroidobacteraceae bacterium]